MKIICTPLTLEAVKLLDVDDCPDSLLESISLFDEEYEQLLKPGALGATNETRGKLIDEYEDEVIKTTEDFVKTLEILQEHLTSENSSVIRKLIYSNTLAIKNRTGLYFFF